jgi:hypothetical protein
MQKKEYVAMHMLLFEVAEWVEETSIDVNRQAYENLAIQPESVHKQKEKHRKAVEKLLEGVTESIDGDFSQPTMVEA